MGSCNIENDLIKSQIESHIIMKIISPLDSFDTTDKYLYDICRSFADPLTVHSLDPSINSSRTKEVVLVFNFQSKVLLFI